MPGVKITSLPVVPLQNSDIIPAGRTGGVTVGILGGEVLNRFADLYTRVNTLSANTIYADDTSTIKLTYNNLTRHLAANLQPTLDLTGWNGKLKLPTDIEIPPGAIMPFAINAAPDGWLVCDGSNSLPNGLGTFQGKTANFSRLYTALSNTYGAFGTLPDLRGYFIRGFGTNADGTASYNVFGGKQADSFQGHKHDLYDPTHSHPSSYTGCMEYGPPNTCGNTAGDTIIQVNWDGNGYQPGSSKGTGGETKNINHRHSVILTADSTGVKVLSATGDQATLNSGDQAGPGGPTPRVSNETRPKNVSLLYCIKY